MPILGITASSKLAVTGAFESIASQTLTGSATSITFNSIPNTYQHLQIRGIALGTNNTQIYLKINNSSSNYVRSHTLYGDGSAVTAANLTYGTSSTYGAAIVGGNGQSIVNTTYPSAFIIDIHDYRSTSKNKVVRIFSGTDSNNSSSAGAKQLIELNSFLWEDTDDISSLAIWNAGVNLTAGTSIALYGIKGA